MESTFLKCNFLTIQFPSRCLNCLGGQAECQRVSPRFCVPGPGTGEAKEIDETRTRQMPELRMGEWAKERVPLKVRQPCRTPGRRLSSDPEETLRAKQDAYRLFGRQDSDVGTSA